MGAVFYSVATKSHRLLLMWTTQEYFITTFDEQTINKATKMCRGKEILQFSTYSASVRATLSAGELVHGSQRAGLTLATGRELLSRDLIGACYLTVLQL